MAKTTTPKKKSAAPAGAKTSTKKTTKVSTELDTKDLAGVAGGFVALPRDFVFGPRIARKKFGGGPGGAIMD